MTKSLFLTKEEDFKDWQLNTSDKLEFFRLQDCFLRE